MLNIYYNRGGFRESLAVLKSKSGFTPFRLFEKIADFYFKEGYQHKNRKKEEQYRILKKFAHEADLGDADFENAIEKDLQSAFNAEEVKRFLKKGWEI